jgi:hypothetical protein
MVMEVSVWGKAFEVTVMVAVPTTPPLAAVIVVVPGLKALASPVELMVATCESLDIHRTSLVMSRAPGLALKYPIAMNCAVSLMDVTVWAAGLTVIEVSAPTGGTVAVTVRAAVPRTPPLAAVIVVVPALAAVACPVELTFATCTSLEIHCT